MFVVVVVVVVVVVTRDFTFPFGKEQESMTAVSFAAEAVFTAAAAVTAAVTSAEGIWAERI